MTYTSRLCLLLSLLWGCSSCNTSLTCGTYEKPGALPNARLAVLINAELEKEIDRMNPTWSPGLIAEAPAHARKWLGEIDYVITHCACNPNNTEKRNKMVYDITLRNGEEIKDVYTGNTCYYQISRPLIMKVVFREGKVSEVFTDGSERKESVDMAMTDVYTLQSASFVTIGIGIRSGTSRRKRRRNRRRKNGNDMRLKAPEPSDACHCGQPNQCVTA